MKRLILALVALALLAPATLAADFENGISPDGCYYVSDSHKLVFSRDASLIGDAEYCPNLKTMSSVWYINRIIASRQQSDAYFNRIQAMKVILKK